MLTNAGDSEDASTSEDPKATTKIISPAKPLTPIKSPVKSASPTKNIQTIYDSDTDDGAQNASKSESNIYDVETDEEPQNDGNNLDASQATGELFAGKSFHFCGNLGAVDEIKLRKIIVEQNGSICARAIDADYVLAKKVYEDDSADLKGVVVKPLWVYESNDLSSLLPIDRYKL